ncbi:hypothetical protein METBISCDRAFT_24167 [Metschnikowia bicuspidata]|uniref:Peptidase S8/S53 domain-containing protein n=1 Tax=Metschnikowia bicuspidata TaxID=27322 RepID=A0A4P9Z9S5_9ASCO|nr:hypothetical protein METBISCDRAFT_24167 [Metschnikowia bicuspidata]
MTGVALGAKALIHAVNDGVDVISISHGLNTLFSQDPVSVVISRIAEYVPVIMSGSNSGNDGLYGEISGAATDNVIAVGSYESNDLVTWQPVLTFDADYYEDICLMPPRGVNSTDFFVIAKVHRDCPAARVLHIAGLAKFVGLVLLKEEEHLLYPNITTPEPFIIASSDDILDFTGRNAILRLTFNAIQTYRIQPRRDHLGGVLSSYTAWALNYDQGLYTHVIAPASPYMAGIIALYSSGHRNATAREVRTKLISTSQLSSDGMAVKNSRTTYYNLTLLSEPYLNLNVTKYRVDNHTISFQNDYSASNTYKITHQSFEVMYAKTDDGMIVKVPPRKVAENIVPYTLSEITLKPGEKLVLFGPLMLPHEVFEQVSAERDVLYETYVINSMTYGTTYMSFDLVDVDFDLRMYRIPPDGLKGFHGPISLIDINESDYLEIAAMQFILPYTGVTNFTFDTFSNGAGIPFGSDRFFYRALKIFGNASKFDDRSLGISPPFRYLDFFPPEEPFNDLLAAWEEALERIEEKENDAYLASTDFLDEPGPRLNWTELKWPSLNKSQLG